jgi:hypothetical protein
MIPAIILILAAPLVIMAMMTFDQLVILEKAQYPEQWETDGSPATFYRKRSEFKRGIKEAFATNKCSLVWLFSTPQWIKGDENAEGILRRLRISVTVWNFGAMPLFIVSALWSV